MPPGVGRASLNVSLAPWEVHRAQGTDWTFYYNKITGESTWQYPQTALASQEMGELEPTADSSYPEDTPRDDPGHKAADCPVSTTTTGTGDGPGLKSTGGCQRALTTKAEEDATSC